MIKVRKLEINGETLPNLYVGGELELPIFNVKTESLSVPGRAGAVFKERLTEQLQHTITLIYRNRLEQLSAAEIGDKVVKFIDKGLSEIRITDQDWIWYGYIDGPFNISVDTNGFAEFDVVITLLNPYRYSQDTYKNTASSDAVTVVNKGTASTPFTLEATALKDSSYFLVTDVENNHFMIGDDNEEVELKNYSPALLTNEFRDKVGFSRASASESIPDRYLGGTLGASFGQNPETWFLNLNTVKQDKGWRGGAYSRSFNRTAQNFRTTFKINVHQRDMGSGKIGQFIYDENNRLMFSMGYQNVHSSKDSGRILFMAYNEAGEERMLWGPQIPAKLKRIKVLTIYFRLERIDDRLIMSYWFYDDTNKEGRHPHTLLQPVKTHTFNDSGKFYQRKIASTKIGIFRGDGNHRLLTALGVHMYELLDKPGNSADYIIKQGDIITLDTQTKDISINGVPMLKEKSLSSNFFELNSGLTNLLIAPENTFDTVVKWRDRYK